MKIFIILILSIYLIYSILPTFYYKIFDGRSRKTVEGKNNIALTFDDGIDKIYTEELLDLLGDHKIKATFFIVANTIEDNLSTLARMVKEGHSIGLHSLEHKDALLKGFFYTRRDFRESMKIVEKYGLKVKYYRPPWGHINLFTLLYIRKYRLQLILWNLMVGDWKDYDSADIISKKLVDGIKEGSIICLHDGRGTKGAPKRTIKALEEVLPVLLGKGYKFITMESENGDQTR